MLVSSLPARKKSAAKPDNSNWIERLGDWAPQEPICPAPSDVVLPTPDPDPEIGLLEGESSAEKLSKSTSESEGGSES